MILESQMDAMLLGLGQALLDGIDAPLETFVEGVPGEDRFLSTQFHEVIEVAGGSPATRVEPDGRYPHLVRESDAFFGVLDVLLAGAGIGRDEVLMNGEADQVDAIEESVTLELAKVGKILPVHLAVQDVESGNPEGGGFFDHLLDRDLGRPEVPVGVTGYAELDRDRFLRGGLLSRFRHGASKGNGKAGGKKSLA